jgi:hypothetical protein
MLGAADELAARGIIVDAQVSRQMRAAIGVVERLRDSDQLGDAVIVHLGTNGPLGDEALEQFFNALSGVSRVIVLTVKAPRDYVEANNTKLTALPAQHPNVSILDWNSLSTQCPGNCFYSDKSTYARTARTIAPN